MRRDRAQWAVAVASAALLLAAFAPLGAAGVDGVDGVAGVATPPVRVDGSASPSPTAAAAPTGCPDLASGEVALSTIIAAGPTKMAECAKAQDASSVTFLAYLPASRCEGCGGISGASIVPAWLSGGSVRYEATTSTISGDGVGALGMHVTTGPRPSGLSDAARSAWEAANALDVRLSTWMGSCPIDDTTPANCSVSRYAGLWLRFDAHLLDWRADTCTGSTLEPPRMPASAVVAYCEQQVVVDAFTVDTPFVCPAAPYTVADLVHFTSDRLVACLGSKVIDVTAYVPVPVSAAIGWTWVGTPGWLASPGPPSDEGWGGMVVLSSASAGFVEGAQFSVRIPPRLGACRIFADDPASCPFRPFIGKWVHFTGHFSDALASTCSGTWTSGRPKPAYFRKAYVQQYCREQFVLSSRPAKAAAPKTP
jgi:hypothetical protein